MSSQGDWGGYREPSNPAAVSGPGSLSQRTDGKQPIADIQSQSYGDGKDLQDVQSGAPLPQASNQAMIDNLAAQVVPMGAPSAQPGVPVTDGANAGPGADRSALGLQTPSQMNADYFRKYLPALIDQASRDNAPPAFKQAVRALIANPQG